MATNKQIYQIKVTVLDISPPIWRRILVESDISLHDLHWNIQQAMGWTNSHLYMFQINGQDYGVPDPDSEGLKNAETVKLSRFVKKEGTKFTYIYDFGDNWDHGVVVEKILEPEKGEKYPLCIDGARACPPEDCGSIPGYENLLKIIANPKHPEHAEMMDWVGGHYDPEGFDVKEADKSMKEKMPDESDW